MPSKKKKYNARFPAGRIKKIMQTDEEVGKVAQAVPVIISRTLELFVESLLTKSMQITQARNAKTLTPSHMKQCILSENRFDFLKDLVKNIPDASTQEDNENNLLFDASLENRDTKTDSTTNLHHRPQTSHSVGQEQSTSRKSSTVIKYGPAVTQNAGIATSSSTRRNSASGSNSNSSGSYFKSESTSSKKSVEDDETDSDKEEDIVIPSHTQSISRKRKSTRDNVPPLIPINLYSQNRNDSLVIDEDYDN
ncbi:hypothetical protein WA026_016449 [Henosepilachna vigintioctopunctata]|uniref:Transcription factor CBF/NF-Y/archaeal histone domain-containing protein n=1 Tax=Henosepilachna vigintioctopunctata TaxID=420089 RepID=A0AAW1UGB9_9CUCU